MTRLTTIKLSMLAVGLALMGYGIRTETPALRWAGIGALAGAFLLRFVRRAQD